jgi:hypothetical protein
MFSKSFDQYIYLNQYQEKTMEYKTNTNHPSPKKKQIARQGKMSPPEIESWMTYSWETKQQTPARLEDAAKYLAVMMTVAITLFLGGNWKKCSVNHIQLVD